MKLGEFNLSHANFSFRVICALKFSLCPFWQKQARNRRIASPIVLEFSSVFARDDETQGVELDKALAVFLVIHFIFFKGAVSRAK